MILLWYTHMPEYFFPAQESLSFHLAHPGKNTTRKIKLHVLRKYRNDMIIV
jgi:hypothetical protein